MILADIERAGGEATEIVRVTPEELYVFESIEEADSDDQKVREA